MAGARLALVAAPQDEQKEAPGLTSAPQAAQTGGGADADEPQFGQNAAPGRRSVPHASQFAMIPPSTHDPNQLQIS